MSSSEDSPREAAAKAPEAGEDAPSELEQKLVEYAKIGLPVGTLIAAGIAGAVQGPAATILVLAGGALVAVIAVFWASVRTLAGETPLAGADAYALGAPRAEEEQKRSVLRALKDLEFERSVGKISPEDYEVLQARYRAEAKRLLRALDEDAAPRRERIEELVAKRLRREGLLDEVPADKADPKPEKQSKQGKAKKKRDAVASAIRAVEKPVKIYDNEEPEPTGPTLISGQSPDKKSRVACGSCGTMNDTDAVFCKKCGTRQRAAEATDEAASTNADEKSESAEKRETGETS